MLIKTVLIIINIIIIISPDEDLSLRTESFATINLRGVSTKLYFNLIFTTQTYEELSTETSCQIEFYFLINY